jgi:hypothetical protein
MQLAFIKECELYVFEIYSSASGVLPDLFLRNYKEVKIPVFPWWAL